MHIKGIRKYPKLYFFSKKYYKNLCIIVLLGWGAKMGQGRGVDSYAVVVARLVGQVIVIVVVSIFYEEIIRPPKSTAQNHGFWSRYN